jgi:predicted protein tyrosine phosphatase
MTAEHQPEHQAEHQPEYQVVGVSVLDEHVLLGDAGLAMAMVAAGAERLVDLRGETRPPRLPVAIDHFPIIDLEPGQDELIAQAAAHVAALARAGTRVGVYCQAGISRTATVAIAYLLLGGATLESATSAVRTVRPQAMPALELRRSLERLAARTGNPVARTGNPAARTGTPEERTRS